jgi:two-component system, sensor histidine kinase and response regulator
MRILLADDQNEIRALVARQLELVGHHVVAVANGHEAVKALELESFDAVLLDEEMPVLDGVQVARAIRDREQKRSARVLLVALTGNCTDQDVQRLLGAGFDAVLGKPFYISSLNSVLSQQAGTPQLAKPSPPKSAPADEPAAFLLERVGGDTKLARQMIRTFLRDAPKRMSEMRKALKRKDSGALASLAHSIKGSVPSFGADTARRYAQELQDLANQADLPGAARALPLLEEEIAKLLANLRGYANKRSPSV